MVPRSLKPSRGVAGISGGRDLAWGEIVEVAVQPGSLSPDARICSGALGLAVASAGSRWHPSGESAIKNRALSAPLIDKVVLHLLAGVRIDDA